MRVSLALVLLALTLSACSAVNNELAPSGDSVSTDATPSEVQFCSWWRSWWRFPTESDFELPDSVLAEKASDRAIEIVRRQPVQAVSGVDWPELTDRYGRAMLAVAERTKLRSSSGWGGVLDQVRDGYQGLNEACLTIPSP